MTGNLLVFLDDRKMITFYQVNLCQKLNAMRTNSIAIQEISLYTAKDEICLKGRMQQGQLSYETSVFISSTQLNMVINQLQKLNEDVDVSASFSSKSDYEGNLFMWMNTNDLTETSIPWETFSSTQKQLLIRA
jgi:hypothetical protein